jgi:hypothetical protein
VPRAAVVLAVLAIGFGTPAAAEASTPAPTPLPPDLVTLEQKMAALQITSLRFTVATKITERHPSRDILKLLSLFGLDSKISGEATLVPPAASVTLGFFGQPLTFRIIGTTSYVYIRQLTANDGGRPWVRLGPGGLIELFTLGGGTGAHPPRAAPLPPTLGQPGYAQPPFAKLGSTLAGARAVSELGPAVVDGLPVTRFLAKLRPGQLESARALRRRRRIAGIHVRLLPPPKPKLTLEVSFASSGLPVRIVLTEALPDERITATVDFPAVNFPLTIEPPAATETISIAELKALNAKEKRRRAASHKRHKSKQ